MATKTATTILIILLCIILFPVIIGLIGGAFGIVFGVFGAIFGVIAGIFGAVFGAIGGIFGWIFGGCHVGLFHWNIVPLIFVIIIIALVTQKRRQQ